MDTATTHNPLGIEPIKKLMFKFAVPSIIAMIISALYNIVDQLFIGNAVGTLGNAATNIAFPLTTLCVALALMFGIGGAASFNLTLGRGDKERAPYYMGNAMTMLVICGVLLLIVTRLFLTPILVGFGSPADVLPYAKEYVGITAIGFPFLLLQIGGGYLVRADGSPKITMACNVTGAVINTILDALFVMVFRWGMAGAAWATVIGQVIAALIVILYLRRCKTIRLSGKHFRVRAANIKMIASIGLAPFFNQILMMFVQIICNNLFAYWGAFSVYGDAIPLACVGIVMKVNMIYFSVVIGLAQGSQPIESFNYGAEKYDRVRSAYKLALISGLIIGIIAFVIFQLFPYQILLLFGNNEKEYFAFGTKMFRIFLLFTWMNCFQPITATFFTSIGKAKNGVILSLTRQLFYFLPPLVILPFFFGVEGMLYAAPIADCLSMLTAVLMARHEFRLIRQKELAHGE